MTSLRHALADYLAMRLPAAFVVVAPVRVDRVDSPARFGGRRCSRAGLCGSSISLLAQVRALVAAVLVQRASGWSARVRRTGFCQSGRSGFAGRSGGGCFPVVYARGRFSSTPDSLCACSIRAPSHPGRPLAAQVCRVVGCGLPRPVGVVPLRARSRLRFVVLSPGLTSFGLFLLPPAPCLPEASSVCTGVLRRTRSGARAARRFRPSYRSGARPSMTALPGSAAPGPSTSGAFLRRPGWPPGVSGSGAAFSRPWGRRRCLCCPCSCRWSPRAQATCPAAPNRS